MWRRSCTVFFFFFQAEDGIRDWSVTGVQTCALPILALHRIERASGRPVGEAPGGDQPRKHLLRDQAPDRPPLHRPDGVEGRRSRPVRSEERRVGKECRSRWGGGGYKKKKEEDGRTDG